MVQVITVVKGEETVVVEMIMCIIIMMELGG